MLKGCPYFSTPQVTITVNNILDRTMKEQLQQRLESLKAEFESGQKVLAELDAKQANLHETLLRISGAIQVLEEELARVEEAPEDDASQLNSPVNNGREQSEPIPAR